MWPENYQMFKLDLEMVEEPEIKIFQPLLNHQKSKWIPKKINFCFIDYAKAFDYVDHKKLWKILKEMGILETLPASWEICVQVKRQQLKPDMAQWTGSKLGKEHAKAAYCHLAYVTSMQSTPCKMPGWVKHELESRLLAEI